jgi:hypothetical protein
MLGGRGRAGQTFRDPSIDEELAHSGEGETDAGSLGVDGKKFKPVAMVMVVVSKILTRQIYFTLQFVTGDVSGVSAAAGGHSPTCLLRLPDEDDRVVDAVHARSGTLVFDLMGSRDPGMDGTSNTSNYFSRACCPPLWNDARCSYCHLHCTQILCYSIKTFFQ